MINLLQEDRHFNNSKSGLLHANLQLVLGDCLSKRPNARKVEQFLAK
jgi:hypothetical protein